MSRHFPPSSRANTLAIATAKGYTIRERGRALVALDAAGEQHHVAADWSEMLAWLLKTAKAGEPKP